MSPSIEVGADGAVKASPVVSERRSTAGLGESMGSTYHHFRDEEAGGLEEPAAADEPLPKRLRWHRQGILQEFGRWGKAVTILKYFM